MTSSTQIWIGIIAIVVGFVQNNIRFNSLGERVGRLETEMTGRMGRIESEMAGIRALLIDFSKSVGRFEKSLEVLEKTK